MSFDNSRFTFDPWKDYFGVVMQQGRVQLDSDWNEWLAEFTRRIQAGALDTLGRAAYPSTTPFAFKIAASAGKFTIGAGRMYVDGLLVENHGPLAAAQWDPALDEMSGAPLIPGATEVALDYTAQPYLPGALTPAGNGPFLVYLDVWQRDVTCLQDPSLVEKAVGIDTTGRYQTVWQVKCLDVSGVAGGVTCSTPDSSIPAWQALIQPPAARLTTGVTDSTPAGPCSLAPNTGYTGLENQFYRVEIHQSGTPGGQPGATLKWSRNNASVETAATAIASVTNTAGNAASQLTVESLGRDETLGFASGSWLEITDDFLELWGQPGELHQIDSIDYAQKTITLDSTVSAASFPLIAGQTDPGRHTRVRRWDSPGAIPVPPAGTALVLEDGITVTLGLNPSSGSFRTGDFWTFAARTADGSVEILNQAFPRGVHHHYARLSVVTFPSAASDCRVPWPPSDCCCTVTVRPTDFTGDVTLQKLIDRYQGSAIPVDICFMPGTYSLETPLRFGSAHSGIGLRACRDGAVVIQAQSGKESQFSDGLIVLDNVSGVSLRGIHLAMPLVTFSPAGGTFAGVPITSLDAGVQTVLNNLSVSIGVRTVNCLGLRVEECGFGFADFGGATAYRSTQPFGVGVFATGQSSDWRITGNTFTCPVNPGSFLAGILVVPGVTFATANAPSIRKSEVTKASTDALAAVSAVNSLSRIRSILSQGMSAPDITTGGGTPNANLAAGGGIVLPSFLEEAVFDGNAFSGITIAAIVQGTTETVRFTRNKVDNCTAGFWLVPPGEFSLYLLDLANIAVTGLFVAMGYPLPQGDTTPSTQTATVPAAPPSVRIYAGSTPYTDSQSNLWLPDAQAATVTISGGTLYQPVPAPTISYAQPSASDQPLYQSERWGDPFSYTFNNLSAFYYRVTLKFAEIIHPSANIRIFDVSINGQQVLTNLDLVAYAGKPDIAADFSFSVLPNPQGQIVVVFTGTSLGTLDTDIDAKIAAVAVEPQWNFGLLSFFLPYYSSPGVFDFWWQLAQLAQQGFANSPASPLRLRMDDNEMQELSAVGILVLGVDQVQDPKVSSVIMTGNRVASAPSDTGLRALSLFNDYVAFIAAVTRCIVSSNMFLNEGADPKRACFTLESGASAPYTQTVPAPEIMVSANVFQGQIEIIPSRYPDATVVPVPMNTWDFLNTVMP